MSACASACNVNPTLITTDTKRCPGSATLFFNGSGLDDVLSSEPAVGRLPALATNGLVETKENSALGEWRRECE